MTSHHNNRNRPIAIAKPLNGSEPSLNNSEPKLPSLGDDLNSNNSRPLLPSQKSPQPNQSPNPNPKKVTSGSGKSANAKVEEVKFDKLFDEVNELFGSLAGMFIMIGAGMKNPAVTADGIVIAKHAPTYTKSLVSLAKKYESVYNALHFLTESSTWGEVITETVTIGVSIACIHGIELPAQVPGVTEGKEALASAHEAIAQMEAQAA